MPRRRAQCLLVAIVLALCATFPVGSWAAGGRLIGAGPAPACVAETEPNDHEGDAGTVTGSVCITGALPEGDQDLFVWDTSAAPAARWDFSVSGVYGNATALKLLTPWLGWEAPLPTSQPSSTDFQNMIPRSFKDQ